MVGISGLIVFIFIQLMKQFIRYLRWSIIMPIYSDTQNDYTKKMWNKTSGACLIHC